ncbi:MAG TPA: hypothetical protein VF605_10375 [Allosphingosinicella sp.]|jgi:hypothetical protein
MNDPALLIAMSASGLLAVVLTSAFGLRGWSEWLELRRLELGGRRGGRAPRVEIAELRARVRRLEAIADGGEM